MSKSQTITNRFFCVRCGHEGIPLARAVGRQKEKHHRKKLWCINCKTEINHIECKNHSEIQEFKENYEKGVYINEAKESMAHVRNQWCG